MTGAGTGCACSPETGSDGAAPRHGARSDRKKAILPRVVKMSPQGPPPRWRGEKNKRAVEAPLGPSVERPHRKKSATRRPQAPDPPQGRGRTRQKEGLRIRQGARPLVDPPGRNNEETKYAIVEVHRLTVEMTAAARWSETQGEEHRGEGWPSQPGSVADLRHPGLPTSVVEHS